MTYWHVYAGPLGGTEMIVVITDPQELYPPPRRPDIAGGAAMEHRVTMDTEPGRGEIEMIFPALKGVPIARRTDAQGLEFAMQWDPDRFDELVETLRARMSLDEN